MDLVCVRKEDPFRYYGQKLIDVTYVMNFDWARQTVWIPILYEALDGFNLTGRARDTDKPR